MSRKTARNKNKQPDIPMLVRKDGERMKRLQEGASEEGQKWVNRKGQRAFKKERKKQDRVTRLVTEQKEN